MKIGDMFNYKREYYFIVDIKEDFVEGKCRDNNSRLFVRKKDVALVPEHKDCYPEE